MAGILGAVSIAAFKVTGEYLNWLHNPMEHRSRLPMETWITADDRVGFGQLPSDAPCEGRAPVSNARGNSAVMDGRLTNRQELQKVLLEKGALKKSDPTDPELVVAAYTVWGGECFAYFRGNFAIALWDDTKGSLWIARDPSGVCPLYYTFHKGRFIFASEVKAILADPEVPRKLDEDSVFHYLTFLCVPPPMTMFEGIRKVEPGAWIRLGADADITSGRYWNLGQAVAKHSKRDTDELSQEMLRTARQAITEVGGPNEKIGVFLDGGLPASALALAIHKHSPSRVAAYSVLVGDLNKEEMARAKKLNESMRAVGIPHDISRVGVREFRAAMGRVSQLQDEPVNKPGDALLAFAARKGRSHGIHRFARPTGANAIFLRLSRWADIVRKSRSHERPSTTWLREAAVGISKLANKPQTTSVEHMNRTLEGQPFYWGYREIFNTAEKYNLLSNRLKHRFQNESSWQVISPYWSRFELSNPEIPVEDWMPFLELCVGLPEGLLMRQDQMSQGLGMAHTFPFLQADLVATCLALHRNTREEEGLPRTTFTRMFEHMLPGQDLRIGANGCPNRSVTRWIIEAMDTEPQDSLEEFFRQTDIFDRKAVRDIFKSQDPARIWLVYNFIQWWRGWFGV